MHLTEAEQFCGCLAVLVILHSYRKTYLWQNLYKNDIILDDEDQRFILIMFGPCAVAFACSMVGAEVDKLLADCYETQENFHYSSYEYKELQTVILILGSRVLQFTAANFMEIKRSTFLSIMAAVTTYFVALVQFC
ncbi:hypothetical protein ABEB36_003958 [Hypothenemus hampei]|uniref:Uncharacterized protein n=1 Tax=Hypothenemus hampei TaxID=57062 RepID=A0ABD1F2B1_HYPHA